MRAIGLIQSGCNLGQHIWILPGVTTEKPEYVDYYPNLENYSKAQVVKGKRNEFTR